MEIKEIKEYTPQVFKAIQHLLTLLVTYNLKISGKDFREIIESDNSHIFVAIDSQNNNLMGMLTVGTYLSPTGRKGWIEDVVVDEAYRGHGIGKELMQHAIQFADFQAIKLLMLTSNPTRVAANSLYQSLGFEKKKPMYIKCILIED